MSTSPRTEARSHARDEVEREADRVSRELQIVADRRFRVYYVGSTPAFTTTVQWLGRGFSTGPQVNESDAAYLDLEGHHRDRPVADVDHADGPGASARARSIAFFVNSWATRTVAKIPTWLNEGLAFLERSRAGLAAH
jgi:hypothetical protein